MRLEDITIGRCLSQGWEAFKPFMWLAIGAYALYQICAYALQSIPVVNVLFVILAYYPLAGGLYTLFLRIITRESPRLEILFSGFAGNWARWMGVGWLLVWYMFVATVACAVLPAILAAAAYFAFGEESAIFIALLVFACLGYIVLFISVTMRWLFTFYIAAEGATARAAIAQSTEMTRGIKLKLVWITLVLGLVGASGIIALGVGLFFTIPLCIFAGFVLYFDVKRLKIGGGIDSQPQSSQEPPTPLCNE